MGKCFGGFGPGKPGGPKRISYGRLGSSSEEPKSKVSIRTRFVPFESPQVERRTARKLGLDISRDGHVRFSSERQLNRYLAHEKHNGREVSWKGH